MILRNLGLKDMRYHQTNAAISNNFQGAPLLTAVRIKLNEGGWRTENN